MIIYAKQRTSDDASRPSWVEPGAPTTTWNGKTIVCPGADPMEVGAPPEDTVWHDVDEGWQCALVGEPTAPARTQRWADLVAVEDLGGRPWLAPCIIKPDRSRAFRVRLGGENYTPQLTPEQDQAADVAMAARDALCADALSGDEISMSVGCRWAAVLLCVGHQLHPSVVQALAITDELLTTGVLVVAAGYHQDKAHGAVA